jgi:phospholipase C
MTGTVCVRCALPLSFFAAMLAACAGPQAPIVAPGAMAQSHTAATSAKRHGSGSTPIRHIVVMIQENRTFNDLFAGFPGATSSKTGLELVPNTGGTGYVQKTIELTKEPLTTRRNPAHVYNAFLTGWDNGAMDGFNLIKSKNGLPEGKLPYQYVDPSTIVPYWTIADQWGLADEMFQTQGSDSFAAHQDLIRGGSCISTIYTCENPSVYTISLIDSPTGKPWGCDAPAGTKTTIINGDLQLMNGKGPAPCSKDFADYGSGGYATLRDLLDAKSTSWKYYTPKLKHGGPGSPLWNAFDVIAPVRYGPEWTDGHISSPETNIFTDIQNGTLPAMSWVIPKGPNSDHPGYPTKDTGPSWIASVVNAVGNSQYWDSTAVIVVWDDWGGFYDPVAPPTPRDDEGGPGFRVAMLVVSPYVKIGSGSQGGYVSHTVYAFGTILRLIEDTFDLGRLGTTDGTSTSMSDMFDYKQSPRQFVTIPSMYNKAYFVREKASDLPPDSD